MNQHISQEQMRQSQHYKAVRDRLFNPPAPKPIAAALPKPQPLTFRDFDEHVRAWRRWKAFSETLTRSVIYSSFSTAGHFEAKLTYDINLDIGEAPGERRSMVTICKDVLRNFPGVTLDEIRGAHRHRNIVAARQACMYAIYTERKDVSLPMLGHFFGGRDHSTALHAVKRVAALRGDPDASKWVDRKNRQANESHERCKAKEQA